MKVSEIAEMLEGIPAGDAGREIFGVAALELAGPAELAYVESPRALKSAAASRAGCLLVPKGMSLPGHTTIAVRHPKLALIRAAEALHPASLPPPGVHPASVVAPDAQLAEDCSVGPNVVIEGGVTIGGGTRLSPGVFLGAGVRVGAQ
ncbi:MAG TPA: LpxD N-terminal domain-containing protein, partial [Terriglobia bacterium]|nr:LpxD N-terminal domain-containing protein [Terriglobia bacterium]